LKDVSNLLQSNLAVLFLHDTHTYHVREMADLTQQILDFAGKGPGGLDEESRLALLQASFKLTAALENPFEKTVRMLFDLDLVDIALAQGGPITLPELASKSKADPALLGMSHFQ
jgi:hypothetical protein